MRVAQALPVGMPFEARAASSVELCVSEWISGSRFRDKTTVVAAPSHETPLLDVGIHRFAVPRRLASLGIARALRALRPAPDVIVTQQHLPTAARIALVNRGTPVVLQTHNLIDPPATGRGAWLRNRIRRLEFATLGGITLISDAARAHFERHWPEVTIPRAVVTNGFDFSQWHPAPEREKLILIVGRAQREKGILEAAAGVRAFLERHGDWRAALILSSIGGDPPYYAEIEATVAPLGDRAPIITAIPFAEVRRMTERAAISVVASLWEEPFGRTALEAHAGGAALISSGSGGLRQISGDTALYLPVAQPAAIAEALETLAGDEALRARLAAAGAERARRLFPLTRDGGSAEPTVCERLDAFLAEVVAKAGRR